MLLSAEALRWETERSSDLCLRSQVCQAEDVRVHSVLLHSCIYLRFWADIW
jgi:hypothetical protein